MGVPVVNKQEKRALIVSLLKYEIAKLDRLSGLDKEVGRRRCDVVESILMDYQQEQRSA